MSSKVKPSFVREYSTEGASLWLHGGTGVGETIVRDFLSRLYPEANVFLMIYAGFWILEGALYDYEISGEQYESLNYYLAERESLDMAGRWKLYCMSIDNSLTQGFLRDAYDATRHHVMETLTDTPPETKKKSLKPAS